MITATAMVTATAMPVAAATLTKKHFLPDCEPPSSWEVTIPTPVRNYPPPFGWEPLTILRLQLPPLVMNQPLHQLQKWKHIYLLVSIMSENVLKDTPTQQSGVHPSKCFVKWHHINCCCWSYRKS